MNVVKTFVEQQTEIQLIYKLHPALFIYSGELTEVDDKILYSYAANPFANQPYNSNKKSKSKSREASTTDS